MKDVLVGDTINWLLELVGYLPCSMAAEMDYDADDDREP